MQLYVYSDLGMFVGIMQYHNLTPSRSGNNNILTLSIINIIPQHDTPVQHLCIIHLRDTFLWYTYITYLHNTLMHTWNNRMIHMHDWLTRYIYTIHLHNTPARYTYTMHLHDTSAWYTCMIMDTGVGSATLKATQHD